MNINCLMGHRYNLGTKHCSKCGKLAEGKDLQLVEQKRAEVKAMFECSSLADKKYRSKTE